MSGTSTAVVEAARRILDDPAGWSPDSGLVALSGDEWAGFSDGACLVAFKGLPVEDDKRIFHEPIVRDVLSKILAAEGATSVACPDLVAFCGIKPHGPECDSCDGSGYVPCEECNGDGEIECECRCGDQHESECGECDGKGKARCEKNCSPKSVRKPAYLFGIMVNLILLSRVLAACPAERVEVVALDDRVGFRADGWLAVLKNLSWCEGSETAPKFPAEAA